MKIQLGKELRTINEKDLFALDVISTWVDIPYDVAKKYEDFVRELREQSGSKGRFNEAVYAEIVVYAKELINPIEEELEEEIMGTTTMNNETFNTTNEMEEVVMKEKIIDANGDFNLEGIREVIEHIGEGTSRIINNVEEDVALDVEEVKSYFIALSGLWETLGLKRFKSDFDEIIYAGLNEDGNLTRIDEMVIKLTELAKTAIKRLEYFGTKKTLAQAFALKCAIGDTYTDKNIFECVASALVWVVKKVTNFIKEKYNLLESKAKSIVVKTILKGIRSLFKAILHGGLVIIKITGHGISFVIAGVIAIGYWAYNTVKKLVLKIAAWVSGKLNKDDEEADIFDDVDDNGATISSADVVIEAYEE